MKLDRYTIQVSEPSTQEQQAPRPDMTLEDAKVVVFHWGGDEPLLGSSPAVHHEIYGDQVAPKLMMVRGRHQEQAQSENAVLVGGAGWCLHAQSFTAKYQSIAYGIICIYILIIL